MPNTEHDHDPTDVIDTAPPVVTLESGLQVRIEELRSRQLCKLLRVLTHAFSKGLAGELRNLFGDTLSLEGAAGDQAFAMRLVSMVLMAIPDAEDETLEFVQAMTTPHGLAIGRVLPERAQERNADLWRRYTEQLDNPTLDDLVTIVEAVVHQESPHLVALGKRLMAMWDLQSRVAKPSLPSPAPNFSPDSPAPSTSSPGSTAGRTTRSRTSPSAGSAKSSQPSRSGASTRRTRTASTAGR